MTSKQITLFQERLPIPQITPAPVRKALKQFMWDDNNEYIAETKLDGGRFLGHIGEIEIRFTSRHKSVKDGLFVERTDNFPHLRDNTGNARFNGTVLDGEIILGSNVSDVMSVIGATPQHAIEYQMKYGWVEYVVFDILFYNGTDVRGELYKQRRYLLTQIVTELGNSFIKVVNSVDRNKRKFYEDVLSNGGEGVILKNINAIYGKDCAKAKRTSTFDVVVMGYEDPVEMTTKSTGIVSRSRLSEQGLIGSIKFGQYVNEVLTELGSCSGMNDETRKLFSDTPDKFIGSVITIKAQERTESGAFRHPAFIKLRDDKNASDCIMYKGES